MAIDPGWCQRSLDAVVISQLCGVHCGQIFKWEIFDTLSNRKQHMEVDDGWC